MPAAAWAQPWAEKTAAPFDRKLSPFSSLPQKPLSPALPTAAGRRKKGLLHCAGHKRKRTDGKFHLSFLAEQQGFEPWHPFRGLRDFESFLPCSTQWKIEEPTPLYWKVQTIGIPSKIRSAPKKHRSHADLNPLQKKRKNPPFGENLKRFCACWRERARELPISSVHPQSMLLLLLTKAKQQRMDEHDNPVRVL